MQHRNIFEREKAGEIISLHDPEYGAIADLITEARKTDRGNEYRVSHTGRGSRFVRAAHRRTGRRIVLAAAALLYRFRQEHPGRQERFHQPCLRIHGQGRHHARRRRSHRPESEPRHDQSPDGPEATPIDVLCANRRQAKRVDRCRGFDHARRDDRRKRHRRCKRSRYERCAANTIVAGIPAKVIRSIDEE